MIGLFSFEGDAWKNYLSIYLQRSSGFLIPCNPGFRKDETDSWFRRQETRANRS
jgi:hypothetical protein